MRHCISNGRGRFRVAFLVPFCVLFAQLGNRFLKLKIHINGIVNMRYMHLVCNKNCSVVFKFKVHNLSSTIKNKNAIIENTINILCYHLSDNIIVKRILRERSISFT